MTSKVVTLMKIFPEEGTDPETLAQEVKKVQGCSEARVEEYVFGAKIVNAAFMCDDSAGKDFEELVAKIPGVSNVQVDSVTLV